MFDLIKKMGREKIFFVFVLIIILNLNYVIGAENNELNVSAEQKARLCLNESRESFYELERDNFSVLRVNDSLNQMDNMFRAQIALKDKKQPYDFSLVIPYCDEIRKIKELALKSKDELIALKKFYTESVQGLNTTEIDKTIAEAEQEIKNERYEKVKDLIDLAYNQIVNAKSRQTTLNIFYEATTQSIGKFLDKNKYYLAGFLAFLIAMFLIYKKAVYLWIIKRKINKLELRKKILKELIMKTQKDYFNSGKISEGEFNIKTKKLAELVRDIDKDIPLLQEELAKLSWNKSKK